MAESRRTAVITGAASGIGRAAAVRLASEGCNLGLLDMDTAGLEETRRLCSGVETIACTTDVRDGDAVRSAVAEAVGRFGRLDHLLNSAGDAHVASIVDITDDQFERTMRVNLWGVYHASRAAIPHLKQSPCGAIVSITSWLGQSGRPNLAAYCASKFAIIGLTQSMAHDLAPFGIRVNAISPGAIDGTKMREAADEENRRANLPTAQERVGTIPLRRLGTPEDVASAVSFLFSEGSSYITGDVMGVTGGLWMS